MFLIGSSALVALLCGLAAKYSEKRFHRSLTGTVSIIAMSCTALFGLTYAIGLMSTSAGITKLENFYNAHAVYEREQTRVAERVSRDVLRKMNDRELFVVVLAPEFHHASQVAEYNTDLAWYRRFQETWFGRWCAMRVPDNLELIAAP